MHPSYKVKARNNQKVVTFLLFFEYPMRTSTLARLITVLTIPPAVPLTFIRELRIGILFVQPQETLLRLSRAARP